MLDRLPARRCALLTNQMLTYALLQFGRVVLLLRLRGRLRVLRRLLRMRRRLLLDHVERDTIRVGAASSGSGNAFNDILKENSTIVTGFIGCLGMSARSCALGVACKVGSSSVCLLDSGIEGHSLRLLLIIAQRDRLGICIWHTKMSIFHRVTTSTSSLSGFQSSLFVESSLGPFYWQSFVTATAQHTCDVAYSKRWPRTHPHRLQ